MDANTELIIERVLAFGDRSEVRWLIFAVGPRRIKAWLRRDGARLLSRRRCNLWSALFGVAFGERDFAGRNSVWPH